MKQVAFSFPSKQYEVTMNIKGKDNKRKIITEVKIFKNRTRNPRTESALSHLPSVELST